MNQTFDFGQGAELRVAGSTVGVFVPKAQLCELIAERDALRRELEEAKRQEEESRLRADEYQHRATALEAEQEALEKALTAAVRDQFPVMDEDKALALIADMEKNGVDSAEVLAEIEAICRAASGGGAHAE